MTSSLTTQALPAGFSRTCWRGIHVGHPSDWEAALLSGHGEPTRCIFVDRRFQRLEVHWRVLPRRPDLKEMYARLGRLRKGNRPEPLTGVPEWTGFVWREDKGAVLHAGRYFRASRCLVQVVVVWPGRRDQELERAVLGAIVHQPKGDLILWQALGLGAFVPKAFDLITASSKVGRVSWEFRRSGRGPAGLTIERLAMPGQWLKGELGTWLTGELPGGYRPRREGPIDCGGRGGTEIYSRRASLTTALLRVGISRLDRAWLCRNEERVYHVAWWRRASGQIDWPAGLRVLCCKGVEFG